MTELASPVHRLPRATLWAALTLLLVLATSLLLLLDRPAGNGPAQTGRLLVSPQGALMQAGRGSIQQLALSSSAEELAVATSTGVFVYRAADFTERWHAPLQGTTRRVVYSPDGRYLAAATEWTVGIFNARSGELTRTFGQYLSPITGLAYHPSGDRVAAGLASGIIEIVDQGSGQICRAAQAGYQLTALLWLPDGRLAAALFDGSRGHIRLLAGCSDHGTDLAPTTMGPITAMAYSATRQLIATGGEDGQVSLYDVESGDEIMRIEASSGPVWSVAFDRQGAVIMAGLRDGRVRSWDVATGELLGGTQAHPIDVTSLLSGPEPGSFLSASSSDNLVKHWRAGASEPGSVLAGHTAAYESIEWSPDGKLLAAGSAFKIITLWDAQTGTLVNTLYGHEATIEDISFQPSGMRLASVSGLLNGSDYALNLWPFPGPGRPERLLGLYVAAWSPDGNRLATSDGNRILIYPATGGEPFVIEGHQNWVRGLAWSPDGMQIVSASEDGRAIVWNAGSGEIRYVFSDFAGAWPASVSWSPDGRLIAAGTLGGALVWDAASGEQEAVLSVGEGSWVADVAFDLTGRKLAAGSDDGYVRLWEWEPDGTVTLIVRFAGHEQGVNNVAWAPDGSRIASASSDGTVIVWAVDLSASE